MPNTLTIPKGFIKLPGQKNHVLISKAAVAAIAYNPHQPAWEESVYTLGRYVFGSAPVPGYTKKVLHPAIDEFCTVTLITGQRYRLDRYNFWQTIDLIKGVSRV